MSKKLKSSVWCYFQVAAGDKIAQCDICGQNISYKSSITNLKRHLNNKHPTVELPKTECLPFKRKLDITLAQNDQVSLLQPGSNAVYLEPSKNTDLGPSCSSADAGVSVQKTIIPTTSSASRQTIISNFIPKKVTVTEKKKLDKLLLGLITKDYQPFSIVEDNGFVEFVHGLNPNYSLPSRKVLSNSILPAAYEQCFNVVKNKMKDVQSVCLTTDCWTSSTNESYLGLTAHYITDDYSLNSVLLECKNNTASSSAENLAREIKQIINKFELQDKVLIVISDNGANVKSAITKELKLNHFSCYAHTLNLIVQKSLEPVQTLQQKVRTIVSHFKRSSQAQEKLFQFQREKGSALPKKLIQECPTRWNSTFFMFERFSELQDSIKSSVALINMDKDKESMIHVLTNEEWQICSELARILKPFEEISKQMCGETFLTGSQVIIMTRGLNASCAKMMTVSFHNLVTTVVNNLQAEMKKRLYNIEWVKAPAICTFLDPRFKTHGFSNPKAADDVKKHIIDLVTKDIHESLNSKETDSITKVQDHSSQNKNESVEFSAFEEIDSILSKVKPTRTPLTGAITEVQRYLEGDILDRHQDPLKWWNQNQHVYPHLSKLVQRRCNMVATSVPCERLFSKAGYIISDRRTRLKPKKVQQITFLNSNS